MPREVLRPDRLSALPAVRDGGVERVRNAGIAGAGGAGFPSYAKWERVASTDYLLVNHQESEPNFFVDKWLGRSRAAEFASLFDALLEDAFEAVVVSAKWTDRDEHMTELEAETGGTVVPPDELPLDAEDQSGVVFAYTDARYQYGMESVLLDVVADTVVGSDLPTDRGWLVQNTETMANVYRALTDGTPVTHTYVHVDGAVPRHRFLEVPIGTPASELLSAAGRPPDELPSDAVLASGGPGWCFEIETSADEFAVDKSTNGLLVLSESTVADNTLGDGRIDVLESRDWTAGPTETEPTATIEPDVVRIPLVTNPDFEGTVSPGVPAVEPGDGVETGAVVATPPSNGIGVPHHASIDGKVTAVTETSIEITAEGAPGANRTG
ncbi:NADH dehydrogenase subunit [Natrinema sp. 1APR25-10V2]|uniref:NADH dehydrogenase subunit n=1 Tax=Natrinema sp. 1APR25-10V2 TaxID=2951081 RepID=UPI0028753A19|nr:NADH dehydrogenase subunit [Natrinema sp. 1APR25-10V2]MDS0476677.1 NADH dehydrogenase subunit [Natrinema sp. 1APR25-10V2]